MKKRLLIISLLVIAGCSSTDRAVSMVESTASSDSEEITYENNSYLDGVTAEEFTENILTAGSSYGLTLNEDYSGDDYSWFNSNDHQDTDYAIYFIPEGDYVSAIIAADEDMLLLVCDVLDIETVDLYQSDDNDLETVLDTVTVSEWFENTEFVDLEEEVTSIAVIRDLYLIKAETDGYQYIGIGPLY